MGKRKTYKRKIRWLKMENKQLRRRVRRLFISDAQRRLDALVYGRMAQQVDPAHGGSAAYLVPYMGNAIPQPAVFEIEFYPKPDIEVYIYRSDRPAWRKAGDGLRWADLVLRATEENIAVAREYLEPMDEQDNQDEDR